MSCNSAIYTVNSGVSVSANGTIPLGSTVRRFGQNLNLNGNGVIVDGAGYYDIDVAITAIPAAAGAITATLLRDGAVVPGGTATVVSPAVGNPVTLPIKAIIRQFGNCSGSTLTVTLSGAATVSNIAFAADKL